MGSGRGILQGCREQKYRASSQPARKPLALQRPPSKIKGDVDGLNLINYVRLVQPVWKRNCAACRQEKKALDLAGVIEGKDG
ncbi:MAG TPA: hypothetical protein VJJ98_03585 [Sedimentisphaerales bacterium]|nr:hypothetical protein [Sedimentisphaerales bacterium]